MRRLRKHTLIHEGAFAADSYAGQLAIGGEVGVVSYYQGFSDQRSQMLQTGSTKPVRQVGFSPDGSLLAAVSDDCIAVFRRAGGDTFNEAPGAVWPYEGIGIPTQVVLGNSIVGICFFNAANDAPTFVALQLPTLELLCRREYGDYEHQIVAKLVSEQRGGLLGQFLIVFPRESAILLNVCPEEHVEPS